MGIEEKGFQVQDRDLSTELFEHYLERSIDAAMLSIRVAGMGREKKIYLEPDNPLLFNRGVRIVQLMLNSIIGPDSVQIKSQGGETMFLSNVSSSIIISSLLYTYLRNLTPTADRLDCKLDREKALLFYDTAIDRGIENFPIPLPEVPKTVVREDIQQMFLELDTYMREEIEDFQKKQVIH